MYFLLGFFLGFLVSYFIKRAKFKELNTRLNEIQKISDKTNELYNKINSKFN